MLVLYFHAVIFCPTLEGKKGALCTNLSAYDWSEWLDCVQKHYTVVHKSEGQSASHSWTVLCHTCFESPVALMLEQSENVTIACTCVVSPSCSCRQWRVWPTSFVGQTLLSKEGERVWWKLNMQLYCAALFGWAMFWSTVMFCGPRLIFSYVCTIFISLYTKPHCTYHMAPASHRIIAMGL